VGTLVRSRPVFFGVWVSSPNLTAGVRKVGNEQLEGDHSSGVHVGSWGVSPDDKVEDT